jgi:2'-5' RNA ligase
MPTSIWLLPPPEIGDRLQKIIDRIASTLPLNGPIFAPHVTLLNGFKWSREGSLTKALSQIECSQVEVKLDHVGYRGSYFVAVPFECHQTESLLALREECQSLSDHKTNEQYLPHLSLAYTDVNPIPQEIRGKIEMIVKEEMTVFQWRGGMIKAMQCDGRVESWIEVL